MTEQNGHDYSSDEVALRIEACSEKVLSWWDGQLDLSHCQCTEADIVRLAENRLMREKLTNLDLSHNELSDATALAEGLKLLTELTNLDLSHNELSNAEALAEGIKPLTKLTVLCLSYNRLSDATALAEGLKPLTKLGSLYLGSNKLADATALAEGLKSLTKLTELELCDNRLSDVAALAVGLKPLTELIMLGLHANGLSDAAALAEGLKPLMELAELNLSFNKFSDATILAEAISFLLPRNGGALVRLDISGCTSLRLPDGRPVPKSILNLRDTTEIVDAIQRSLANDSQPACEIQPSSMNVEKSIEFFIDPGEASEEEIRDVLRSLSNLQKAFGGLGLEFAIGGVSVLAREEVPV